MMNGTIKGKVIARREFPDAQRQNVCAVVALEVKGFVFGKKVEQVVECWVPNYMEKRLPFIMDEKNVYLLITFDWARGASENLYGQRVPDFGVIVSAVYHG